MSHRLLQVNETIQRELSRILVEFDLSGYGLVTITSILTSPDLRQAIVWLSILNNDKPQAVVDLLNKRSSEFYKPLSDRLRMKYVPKLEFRHDDKIEDLTRLDSLFDKINE